MADLVYQFACTVPAGTPIAAPLTIDTSMPPCVVERVDIRIPPGPKGTVGFRLTSDGTQVVPTISGQWVVTDDEAVPIPLTNQHDSGRWAFTGYNLGNYPHTVQVRYLVNLTAAPVTTTPAGSALIAAAALSS